MAFDFKRPELPSGVEVGRYPSAKEAKERMLVLLAAGIVCGIRQEGVEYLLEVEPDSEDRAQAELAACPVEVEVTTGWKSKLPSFSLPTAFLWTWLLILAYGLQMNAPIAYQDWGRLDSQKFVSGEFWRPATALLLHGDSGHLLSNLLFGCIFLALLGAEVGAFSAIGWSLLAGIIGNVLNGIAYGSSGHFSVGSSTAVFGCLGFLVGRRAVLSIAVRGYWSNLKRALIIPLGVGLGFLGWLGASEKADTDIMAHFWGLLAGSVLGAIVGFRDRRREAESILETPHTS